MTPFDRAIAFVLPHENAYARGHWGDENYVVVENVSGDAGGLTKYGIDQRSHPDVDIVHLTKSQAVSIYRKTYWDAHNLDALPDKLAICAFDVWVNGGNANLWLQHAYNIAPSHGNKPFLKEDGVLGPISLAALASANLNEMVTLFIGQRDTRFRFLASHYANDERFLLGWLQRDADLRKFLGSVS